MILNKIDDPRDNLEKARRMELVRFAQACGLPNITEHMPAMLIRRELRNKGMTNIKVPPRILGSQHQPNAVMPSPDQKVVEVNAADDLARQFRAEQPVPAIPRRGRPKSEINKLRDECKRLGIKMDRRDNVNNLREKIKAHGEQDAA